jgi:hypothetical protein
VEDGWPTSCLFVLRNGSCKAIDDQEEVEQQAKIDGGQ